MKTLIIHNTNNITNIIKELVSYFGYSRCIDNGFLDRVSLNCDLSTEDQQFINKLADTNGCLIFILDQEFRDESGLFKITI